MEVPGPPVHPERGILAKIDGFDQHDLLHRQWPTNCCLCAKELVITDLQLKVRELEERLKEHVLNDVKALSSTP